MGLTVSLYHFFFICGFFFNKIFLHLWFFFIYGFFFICGFSSYHFFFICGFFSSFVVFSSFVFFSSSVVVTGLTVLYIIFIEFFFKKLFLHLWGFSSFVVFLHLWFFFICGLNTFHRPLIRILIPLMK